MSTGLWAHPAETGNGHPVHPSESWVHWHPANAGGSAATASIISEPTVPASLKPVLVVTMVALVLWGSVKPAAGVLEVAPPGLHANEVTLADDAFDKAGEAYIKSLFDRGGRDKSLVKDQLSRADYNSKQKHRFELHESRKGLGVAYFRTNEGNYGKLLHTWGIGPKPTSRKSLSLIRNQERPTFADKHRAEPCRAL